MRISDWSSDVCSSDLIKGVWEQLVQHAEEKIVKLDETRQVTLAELQQELDKYQANNQRWQQLYNQWVTEKEELTDEKRSLEQTVIRSEERREGKEWVSTCRSRW